MDENRHMKTTWKIQYSAANLCYKKKKKTQSEIMSESVNRKFVV